jgi:hypothetical protein
MSKKPSCSVSKVSLLVSLLVGVSASAGCTSTLGLEEYEVTSLERCDDDLVDFAADEHNCGECGVVCPSGSECVSGTCDCPDDGMFCNDAVTDSLECADLRTDEEHCGKCGESCATGASCNAGKCSCDVSGQTVCSDECVDLDSDEANCGRCGNECAKGASCNDGECECDVKGELACDGACTDPDSDADHCGACGHACDIANTSPMCASAECYATECTKNYFDCDDDLYRGESGTGCEIDGQNDEQNCGSCGFSCAADRVCDGGECVCDVPDAGGACDPRSNCGCDLGTNCSVQGDSWSCIPAGYGTESSTCTTDQECALGYGCVGGVCHARCDKLQIENDSCGTNGVCVQVVDSDGADIDGYKICAEPCNPSAYDSAPYGAVTCPYNQQCVVADGTTVCAKQGTVYGTLGSSCSSYQDCSAGYGCVDSLCQPYCVMNYSSCSSYFGYQYTCAPFSTPVDVVGSEIGYCDNGATVAYCGDSCNDTTICPDGATCIDTIEDGPICLPAACQTCFDYGQGCNWSSASCTATSCGSG